MLGTAAPPMSVDVEIYRDYIEQKIRDRTSRFWIEPASGDLWLAQVHLVNERYVDVLQIQWSRLT